MVIVGSKINFCQEHLDRCENVAGGQEMAQSVQFCDFKLDWWTFDVLLKNAQCCASVQKVQHGDLLIETDSEQACIVENSKSCVRGRRRVLRTLSGWPEAT